MTDTTWWLMVAGILVACELLNGAFYLLMLALGALVGSLAAWAGLFFSVQVILASLFGAFAVFGLYQFRKRSGPATGTLNFDVGQHVHVAAWEADGTCRVMYRDAPWGADCASSNPQPGLHKIVSVNGTRLVLERIDSSSSTSL